MTHEPTPTEARQGEKGRSMLTVLLISVGLAVVLAIGGYVWLFQSEPSDLAAPIPTETGTEGVSAAPAGNN